MPGRETHPWKQSGCVDKIEQIATKSVRYSSPCFGKGCREVRGSFVVQSLAEGRSVPEHLDAGQQLCAPDLGGSMSLGSLNKGRQCRCSVLESL
jgi:hypothetical protein